jgi:hypothetical protein
MTIQWRPLTATPGGPQLRPFYHFSANEPTVCVVLSTLYFSRYAPAVGSPYHMRTDLSAIKLDDRNYLFTHCSIKKRKHYVGLRHTFMPMHRAKLISYLFLSICCLIWRCKPTPIDTQQPQDRVRVKKVTVDLGFLRTVDNYSYNADGQLASVLKQIREKYTTPINHYPYYIDSEQHIVLSYDQQKRLIRMEGLPNSRWISFIYTYSYTNRNSQPTFILYTPTTTDSVFNSRQETVYQVYYGADELPTKITSLPGYNGYVGTDEYTYANGNIVAIRQSSSSKYYEPRTIQWGGPV